ncbi:MAG: hypothetical protein KatS3mg086_112 [Candidatus Dojkabacteria bacterium]|nr:MAG: hypothetical protein KatS3mg086_112 [Candidatus Dojkabacteria bacterium]
MVETITQQNGNECSNVKNQVESFFAKIPNEKKYI